MRDARRIRAEFLQAGLDSCTALAGLANTEFQMGQNGRAQECLAKAERCYALIAGFLSGPQHIADLGGGDIGTRRSELQQLRKTLDQLGRSVDWCFLKGCLRNTTD